MEKVILWCVIFTLLIGYIILIRIFKNIQSKSNSPSLLINSMKLKCDSLKLHIEQQNEDIAFLLTENEQLKEALRGDVGGIIERNNKEIQSLKKEIMQLQKLYDDLQACHFSQKLDSFIDHNNDTYRTD